MSGAFARFGHWRALRVFNETGRAGTRRFVMLGLVSVGLLGIVAVVSLAGDKVEFNSRVAKLGTVDALPGGTHSTPEQERLRVVADNTAAAAATKQGKSYSPEIAPSLIAQSPASLAQTGGPTAVTPPAARTPARPMPRPPHAVSAIPVAYQPASIDTHPTTEKPPVVEAAALTGSQDVQQYAKAISDFMAGWGGRPPQTVVILPEGEVDPTASAALAPRGGVASPSATRAPEVAMPVAARPAEAAAILIPAGRFIYAHPILALSSDASSPAVFEADSGPVARDRMIGSFSRQDERLIIRITAVIHQGRTLATDGVVIAPDTMEASVASDVDQHYAERFILPAAAAFVQGLGQAIATTSNSVAVLSPFGGATTSTHLNLDQQLGIAAGAAAGQAGATLAAAAPKGPTVTLAANVSVGVMFLKDVTEQGTN